MRGGVHGYDRLDGSARDGRPPAAPRVVSRVVAGAVGKAQGPAGIAQQGKGKAELLREGGVLCHRVETRPQDFHIAGAKLSDLVAEPATLGGSPRGVGFGIEP